MRQSLCRAFVAAFVVSLLSLGLAVADNPPQGSGSAAAIGQNLSAVDSPTFAGVTLSSPLTVANGGTGLSTMTAANRMLYSTAAGTLTSLAAGTDTYVLTSASGVPTWSAPSSSTGYAFKLPLAYGSATTVVLGSGSCRSITDASNVVITSDQTIDITATGSLGLNTLTSATTFTTAGSSTVTAAASVWTSDLTTYRRTLTGTFATTTTTLTGTSSKLLSEVTIGDVVRVGSEGAGRITAVTSDTSATFVATLPNDGGSTGMTAYVNEGLTFKVGSETARMVNTISDGGLTIVMSGAASGTAGSQAGLWDVEVASQHLYAYAATISSNGRAFLSTHRSTTPNAITGLTAYRRVGVCLNNTLGNILPFAQHGSGLERTYQLLVDSTTENTRVINNGTAASWAPVVILSLVVPPTSRCVTLEITSAGGARTVLRPRNIGGSTDTPGAVFSTGGGYIGATLMTMTDGAQCIDYTGTSVFADVASYVDSLN